jgi:hypothetical protein
MKDLELATTNELMEEISKRVDAFVFLGYIDRSDKTYALVTETKGTSLEMIGLSWMLGESIKDMVKSAPRGGGES